ncbi:PKD domain-containing protein [Isoptericola variabilis]|uniref:PKD domain-containing protein n=1 Tax=Isoptericola variabilis TaxID=139208 RepID=UPI0002D98A5F|nr:PKD domain-containing protein [Isoptericola variabilis]
MYWRATAALCLLTDLAGFVTELAASCTEGEQLAFADVQCDDGFALGALFRAQRLPSGNLSDPELVAEGTCVTPADLAAEAAREFATLPITPSPLHVQPPDGWTLINVETVTYTEDAAQDFETTLLGVPVVIRALPDEFAWDYGDGTTTVTEHPGAPYPANTVGHTYTAPGEVSISLTTTWRGQFQIAGTATWTDVPGTATTTTSTGPITVHEARTRLVEDPAG